MGPTLWFSGLDQKKPGIQNRQNPTNYYQNPHIVEASPVHGPNEEKTSIMTIIPLQSLNVLFDRTKPSSRKLLSLHI